jgi:hypothetical protein
MSNIYLQTASLLHHHNSSGHIGHLHQVNYQQEQEQKQFNNNNYLALLNSNQLQTDSDSTEDKTSSSSSSSSSSTSPNINTIISNKEESNTIVNKTCSLLASTKGQQHQQQIDSFLPNMTNEVQFKHDKDAILK